MRVLLVDDHPMAHEVLGAVVRSVFADAAILTAGSLAEALEHARAAHPPELVLLDLGLPDSAGIDTLRRYRKAQPDARIVVVSASDDRESVLAALDEGAVGYVPKGHAPPLIAAALRVVEAGGVYVPQHALESSVSCAVAARKLGLTTRQYDVLRLIGKGLPNKQIAQRLKISEETVKYHAGTAYQVLGVTTRTQAMLALARRGIRFD